MERFQSKRNASFEKFWLSVKLLLAEVL